MTIGIAMTTVIFAIIIIVALGIYRFKVIRNLAIFLTSIWLALFITNLSYSYYKNISVNEWRILGTWVGSYFYIGSKEYQNDYTEVTYPSKYGFDKTVKFKAFKQDEYVHDVLFRFKECFKRSLFLSILDEIVIIIALVIFFVFKDLWNFDELYNQYHKLKQLKLKQLKPVEKYNQANSNLKPQETPIQQEQTPLKEAQKQDTITHENFENKTTESKNTDDKAIIKLEAKNVINENIFKF